MSDSLKKTKPTLDSLLATRQVQTGKQIMEMLKAKAKQLEEFTRATEFEARYKKRK